MNVPSLVNSPPARGGPDNWLPGLYGNTNGTVGDAAPPPFVQGPIQFRDSSHANDYLFERWGRCWVPTAALGPRFRQQAHPRMPVVEVPCPPPADHRAHKTKQRPHHPPRISPEATTAWGHTTTTNDGLCERTDIVGIKNSIAIPFRIVTSRVPCVDADTRGGVYGKFVRVANLCFVRSDSREPEPGQPSIPLGPLLQVPCSLIPPLPGLHEERQRLSAAQRDAVSGRQNRALSQTETGEPDSAPPAESAPWRCVIS